MIRLKNEEDIKKLLISGKILSFVLKSLKNEIRAGVSLDFLDNMARKIIKRAGAKPAFLGYKPAGNKLAFPSAICTSVNNVIVHGVPGNYFLNEGDIVSIDLGINYENYFTDAAITVPVGRVSSDAQRLIESVKLALIRAIAKCKQEKFLGDIGAVIEKTAREFGVNVIKALTGHGVGFSIHEEPNVLNYGRESEGLKLQRGLVIAIEPMFSLGDGDVIQLSDESYSTKDESLSAHFEHTVAVTEDGPLVLTE